MYRVTSEENSKRTIRIRSSKSERCNVFWDRRWCRPFVMTRRPA